MILSEIGAVLKMAYSVLLDEVLDRSSNFFNFSKLGLITQLVSDLLLKYKMLRELSFTPDLLLGYYIKNNNKYNNNDDNNNNKTYIIQLELSSLYNF